MLPEPVPESCEALNQEVVRFVGYMVAVQLCVLSERFTVTVPVAGMLALGAASATVAGVEESVPGFPGGATKETFTPAMFPSPNSI